MSERYLDQPWEKAYMSENDLKDSVIKFIRIYFEDTCIDGKTSDEGDMIIRQTKLIYSLLSLANIQMYETF